jgi:hypothetical protein
MAIASDKRRTGIVLPITLIDDLQKIAASEGRSFNNLVTRILTDHVEQQHKLGKLPEKIEQESSDNNSNNDNS